MFSELELLSAVERMTKSRCRIVCCRQLFLGFSYNGIQSEQSQLHRFSRLSHYNQNVCPPFDIHATGKTYSMFGEGAGNSRGMIPRCMEEVFAQLDNKAKVQIKIYWGPYFPFSEHGGRPGGSGVLERMTSKPLRYGCG